LDDERILTYGYAIRIFGFIFEDSLTSVLAKPHESHPQEFQVIPNIIVIPNIPA
jgi:hypothetical protein